MAVVLVCCSVTAGALVTGAVTVAGRCTTIRDATRRSPEPVYTNRELAIRRNALDRNGRAGFVHNSRLLGNAVAQRRRIGVRSHNNRFRVRDIFSKCALRRRYGRGRLGERRVRPEPKSSGEQSRANFRNVCLHILYI